MDTSVEGGEAVLCTRTLMLQVVERSWYPAAVLAGLTLCYVFAPYVYWVSVLVCALYTLWSNVKAQIDDLTTVEAAEKFVLITGCDAGLGKAFAIRAHQIGYTVLACCHDDDSEGARDLMRSYVVRMHVIKMDVTQSREVERALKRIKKYMGDEGLWAVVNAADVLGGGPLELVSLEHFQHVVDVNLLGSVRVTKTFLPLLRLSQGRIINISRALPSSSLSDESAYVSSKFGLEAFTSSIREELRQFNIQVCLLEVGETYTHPQVQELGRRLFEEFYSSSENVQQAYPWDSVERLVNKKHGSVKHSALPSQQVLELFQRLLLHSVIQDRYTLCRGSIVGMWNRVLNTFKNVFRTQGPAYKVSPS